MELYVSRFGDTPFGTFGRLHDKEWTFSVFSLEPRWNGAPIAERCIPVGRYHFHPAMYYGGDGVGGNRDYATYEIFVPGHTEIKFHIGNWARDTKKCVLTGLNVGVPDNTRYPGEWGITSSKLAFEKLMKHMTGVVFGYVTFKWAVGE